MAAYDAIKANGTYGSGQRGSPHGPQSVFAGETREYQRHLQWGTSGEMNIFETIARVTSGFEQYHSQFLADALAHSLNGDRSLFEAVWKLSAPPGWEAPVQAEITPEELVEGGQIDICMRCVAPHQRVVGIEVKTVDASAHPGQLERYLDGLKRKYPESQVQIAYLTPFNRERAGEAADRLATVRLFDQFLRAFPQARHVSWLDVAGIPWDGSPLWKQHQAFVIDRISPPSKLAAKLSGPMEWDRELDAFFGEEPTAQFWEALSVLGIYAGENGAQINLTDHGQDLASFAKALVQALGLLLEGDRVSRNARKLDRFPAELRWRFLDSPYREVHAALFGFSQMVPYVWAQGRRDYGVRTAHKDYSSGVSLVRSNGPGGIVVGERR